MQTEQEYDEYNFWDISITEIVWQLDDPTGAAVSTIDLPQSAPTLDDWETNVLSIHGIYRDSVGGSSSIENFTIGCIITEVSTDPYSFGTGYIGCVSLQDINDNQFPEIAILRIPTVCFDCPPGRPIVYIKDTETKNVIIKLKYNKQYIPTDLSVIPDINGNGIPEIGVLGRDPATGKVHMQIKDALTGDQLKNISLPK